MKATGMIRGLDGLGRVVVPKEIRRVLGLSKHDSLEIFTNDNREIILKKYAPGCQVQGCTEVEGIVELGGVRVCSGCLERLKQIAQGECK